ncbi:MAG: transposase [Okeania sp. SIO2F4]|nr:transposase [Okeania sp. SIO2F4]
MELIERTLSRGARPGIVLIDAGYGNNTAFVKKREERKLNYLGGVAKNRKVIIKNELVIKGEKSLEELALSL